MESLEKSTSSSCAMVDDAFTSDVDDRIFDVKRQTQRTFALEATEESRVCDATNVESTMFPCVEETKNCNKTKLKMTN